MSGPAAGPRRGGSRAPPRAPARRAGRCRAPARGRATPRSPTLREHRGRRVTAPLRPVRPGRRRPSSPSRRARSRPAPAGISRRTRRRSPRRACAAAREVAVHAGVRWRSPRAPLAAAANATRTSCAQRSASGADWSRLEPSAILTHGRGSRRSRPRDRPAGAPAASAPMPAAAPAPPAAPGVPARRQHRRSEAARWRVGATEGVSPRASPSVAATRSTPQARWTSSGIMPPANRALTSITTAHADPCEPRHGPHPSRHRGTGRRRRRARRAPRGSRLSAGPGSRRRSPRSRAADR